MSEQYKISEYINNLPLKKTFCKGYSEDEVYEVISNICSMYNHLLSEVYEENENLKNQVSQFAEHKILQGSCTIQDTVQPQVKTEPAPELPVMQQKKKTAKNRKETDSSNEDTRQQPVTDKQLKKLNRRDLLEIMLEQGRENEKLRIQLNDKDKTIEALHKQLENRRIEVTNAGSIAEASIRLNGVFEAAERAAQQYLDNLRELYEKEKAAGQS